MRWCQFSSVRTDSLRLGVLVPTELTIRSILPKWSTASLTTASTSARFEASALRNINSPPAAAASAANSFSGSSRRAAAITLHPALASANAVAFPIPLRAPATIAVCPERLPMNSTSARCDAATRPRRDQKVLLGLEQYLHGGVALARQLQPIHTLFQRHDVGDHGLHVDLPFPDQVDRWRVGVGVVDAAATQVDLLQGEGGQIHRVELFGHCNDHHLAVHLGELGQLG